MGLYVQEDWFERQGSKLIGLGDSSVYETSLETPSEAYHYSQRQFGRCTSRIYVDGPSGNPVHIGWVFQKRAKYKDSEQTYLQETWVTLHDGQPTRTISYNYHII